MEDFISASVFITGLAALFLFAALVARPYLPSAYIEAPAEPGDNVPTRSLYVYAVIDRYNHTRYYMMEYVGPDAEQFRQGVGVPGVLVAKFYVYPGGYRCELYGRRPVRIGDPYTGLWCPPPFDARVDPSCVPVNVASKGRWLVVQYRCP
ncbi:hypothetical protein [Pyrobaculum ferrireducens]|uniref:Uncharacterized protein n=1 Tax=Pyrobaculum ferrireducens TaxID=1104324 RepID=G7VCT8_9CREN|nr:hypothetical protein [Pyrobaculum ferrireducens]AET32627.1 hypothetical protein P186_1196 [Pyrobaculum ferrireducens]